MTIVRVPATRKLAAAGRTAARVIASVGCVRAIERVRDSHCSGVGADCDDAVGVDDRDAGLRTAKAWNGVGDGDFGALADMVRTADPTYEEPRRPLVGMGGGIGLEWWMWSWENPPIWLSPRPCFARPCHPSLLPGSGFHWDGSDCCVSGRRVGVRGMTWECLWRWWVRRGVFRPFGGCVRRTA